MIPSITAVRMSGAATRAELPLLVLGPDLGTTASLLWADCAAHLSAAFDVLAWDLPGHGHNRGVPEEGFTIAELAAGVLRVVDDVLEQRGELGAPFAYAGLLTGATVGRQLLLDEPSRVRMLVTLGTPVAFDSIPASRGDLGSVAPAGYDLVLAALSEHDATDRADELSAFSEAGRLVVLAGDDACGPLTEPARVARTLRRHLLGEIAPVDPAAMLTAFEHLVVVDTGQADEGIDLAAIWQRPGLELRGRHLIALVVLACQSDLDALGAAVRAAVADGVTPDEVFECLLQVASHVGVEVGRQAVRVAQRALHQDAG